MEIHSCRICGSKKLTFFFNLGKQPLANSLLKKSSEKEKKYPLSLGYCHNCSLVQLSYTVDAKKLFSDYVWVTKTSETAKRFAERFYKELIKRANKNAVKYILEIASNDGTFLLPFKKTGYKVLGIDPAENISKMARESGIPTKSIFFNSLNAKKLLKQYGKAHIIFARNVLPHVFNTIDFVKDLKNLLEDNGVLAIEVHYAKGIQEELHYDSIYHEHLCYFTLKTLERLLNDQGLYIFDVVKSPISGGSIVAYATGKQLKKSAALNKYIRDEELNKTNYLSSWKRFSQKSIQHRNKFLRVLEKANRKGLVVGYGASARSSTLLNFSNISTKQIKQIIDKNELKQGFYTAGTHIPIETAEKVLIKKPSTVVILAWNFVEEITKMLKKDYNYKGSFIIPLPNDVVIKK